MKPDYSQDFHLDADFPIAGRIVDAVGKPIAGAAVAVEGIYNLADRRWFRMRAAIKAGKPTFMSREESDPNHWFTPLYPTAWKMITPGTTDLEGRFRLAGVGRDRAIKLAVSGPGVRCATFSVLTRNDVANFTEAIRKKYPRTRRPDGYYSPIFAAPVTCLNDTQLAQSVRRGGRRANRASRVDWQVAGVKGRQSAPSGQQARARALSALSVRPLSAEGCGRACSDGRRPPCPRSR